MKSNSKDLPLISVIVPAYNEQEHIEECLVSIKRQTYPKIELIVIDDGSTDATANVAKRYADVFITQHHQGPGVARNKGAKRSSGEILIFIDADMYLDKEYIKNIIKPLRAKKAFATFTKEEYVANPDNIWSKCLQIDNNLPPNRRISLNSPRVSTKFRAIDKDYFFKCGGYKNHVGYGEDDILTEKKAIEAPNAICYHYNPETLKEVFFSARWIGRSENMQKNLRNIVKYSFINSVLISFKNVKERAPLLFSLYKLIFDGGILVGLFTKKPTSNFSK